MRYHVRTLLMVLALGPLVLAGGWWGYGNWWEDQELRAEEQKWREERKEREKKYHIPGVGEPVVDPEA